MNRLPYGRPFVEEDDIEAVVRVLRSDWLTTGPAVGKFEAALAAATGARHAVACSSGTAALHLALAALGIGPDDRVVVPALTFAATANAARYVGAEPVFADVEPETGLLSADGLTAALDQHGPATAVIPVHLAGQTCDMPGLAEVAREHGMKVVEDACHAIGGTVLDADGNCHPVGACPYSDAATFSFHPVKTVAMGEGGAVTTNDAAADALMRRLRHHGVRRAEDGFLSPDRARTGNNINPWYYEIDTLGFNYRASDIHCALGTSQLGKLDRLVDRRKELVARYDARIAPLAPVVKTPARRSAGKTAWHLYVVLIDFAAAGVTRAQMMRALDTQEIGTQVHYIPLPLMPAFENCAGSADIPGAMSYYARCLSLPLFVGMENEDVDRVTDALSDILAGSIPAGGAAEGAAR